MTLADAAVATPAAIAVAAASSLSLANQAMIPALGVLELGGQPPPVPAAAQLQALARSVHTLSLRACGVRELDADAAVRAWLCALTPALRTLLLSGNKLRSVHSAALAELTHLRHLDLADNALVGLRSPCAARCTIAYIAP